ncbi:aminodeoxychorismate lyase [Echinimonas agarilytica]|uniref:Aminodeoxychorismate lyase n=1 Tax=Echinimonas agarilytica TaxID=1215918 RepID=A0AA41W7R3_9GAMM|nr:aminodeoxychorismate lyase [Echinimonas agarilytica]MCM2679859.1 aminodeoxychorismate lyase [Echinimonas agarilytica]
MWINGQLNTSIDPTDRSVSFGDGVFTTCRVVHGKIEHLELHLQRLKRGCHALSIKSVDWALLEHEMHQAASSTDTYSVCKAIVSRGCGGRGYSPEQVTCPTRIVGIFDFPSFVSEWRHHGIALVLGSLKLGVQPALAGHKTLNRLEQVLGKQELIAQGALEGVFCDSNGYVVECNASNLFWRKGTEIFTPRLNQAGVAGICRQRILQYCAEHHTVVNEVSVYPAQLEDADEMFICNGVMGPVPITHFQQHQFVSHFFCRLLQKELDPLNV